MNHEELLALYRRASELERGGRIAEAQELFHRVAQWVEDRPLAGGAFFHLGEMARQQGLGDEARAHFRRCLELLPDHERARERFARFALDAGETRLLERAARPLEELRELGALHTPARVADLALQEVVRERFLDPQVGAACGVDRAAKLDMLRRFQETVTRVPSGTSWLYHTVLATAVLSIPPDRPGAVIECGVWRGASTCNLSLACAAAGRTLLVCDSFAGLPEDEPARVHHYPHLQVYGYYRAGMYCGRLEEVQANLAACGRPDVCRFLPGFFKDTLPGLREPLALAFLDVDLASSLRDCVRWIWPLLAEDGCVYTDDSCDMETAAVWFDEPWWRSELATAAPGYVGSGCGLPLASSYSSLGYTRKVSAPDRRYRRIDWLVYPDTPSQGENP